MTDKRRLLRASPPEDRIGRTIQVQLSAEVYRRLYFMAFDNGLSVADQVRALIVQERDG